MRAPTVVEIMMANPGMTRARAEDAARFARETVDEMIRVHGSIEAAIKAPGRPWVEIKKELGL